MVLMQFTVMPTEVRGAAPSTSYTVRYECGPHRGDSDTALATEGGTARFASAFSFKVEMEAVGSAYREVLLHVELLMRVGARGAQASQVSLGRSSLNLADGMKKATFASKYMTLRAGGGAKGALLPAELQEHQPALTWMVSAKHSDGTSTAGDIVVEDGSALGLVDDAPKRRTTEIEVDDLMAALQKSESLQKSASLGSMAPPPPAAPTTSRRNLVAGYRSTSAQPPAQPPVPSTRAAAPATPPRRSLTEVPRPEIAAAETQTEGLAPVAVTVAEAACQAGEGELLPVRRPQSMLVHLRVHDLPTDGALIDNIIDHVRRQVRYRLRVAATSTRVACDDLVALAAADVQQHLGLISAHPQRPNHAAMFLLHLVAAAAEDLSVCASRGVSGCWLVFLATMVHALSTADVADDEEHTEHMDRYADTFLADERAHDVACSDLGRLFLFNALHFESGAGMFDAWDSVAFSSPQHVIHSASPTINLESWRATVVRTLRACMDWIFLGLGDFPSVLCGDLSAAIGTHVYPPRHHVVDQPWLQAGGFQARLDWGQLKRAGVFVSPALRGSAPHTMDLPEPEPISVRFASGKKTLHVSQVKVLESSARSSQLVPSSAGAGMVLADGPTTCVCRALDDVYASIRGSLGGEAQPMEAHTRHLRTHVQLMRGALLEVVFAAIFENLLTTLLNRLVSRVEVMSSLPGGGSTGRLCFANLAVRRPPEAMRLKLLLSVLETWLQEHDLYTAIVLGGGDGCGSAGDRSAQLFAAVRQFCDLVIMPKQLLRPKEGSDEATEFVHPLLVYHLLTQYESPHANSSAHASADPAQALLLASDTVPREAIARFAEAAAFGGSHSRTSTRELQLSEMVPQYPVVALGPLLQQQCRGIVAAQALERVLRPVAHADAALRVATWDIPEDAVAAAKTREGWRDGRGGAVGAMKRWLERMNRTL